VFGNLVGYEHVSSVRIRSAQTDPLLERQAMSSPDAASPILRRVSEYSDMVSRTTDTAFLKFLGILLITNSHLDSLYPLKPMGTGGVLGNAIFFMVAGYGLVLSDIRKPRSFLDWFGRRIVRIYPSTFIVFLTGHILSSGCRQGWALSDYVRVFIWPTSAWFIGAIMVFYPLYFCAMKCAKSCIALCKINVFIGLLLAIFIPYMLFYLYYVDLSRYSVEGPTKFKWLFYFQMMLLGGSLGMRYHRASGPNDCSLWPVLALLVAYVLITATMGLGTLTRFQFLVHIVTMLLAWRLLVVARLPSVRNRILRNRWASCVIGLLGSLTLEIYLLQPFIYQRETISDLVFPLNVVVFAVSVIGLSLLVAHLSSLIRTRLLHFFMRST